MEEGSFAGEGGVREGVGGASGHGEDDSREGGGARLQQPASRVGRPIG